MNTTELSVWRIRDYRTWFMGDTASEIGAWISSLAMTLLAYSVTRDVWLAGVIGAAEATARAVGVLPGGVIADSLDRRKLMIAAAAASAIPYAILIICWYSGVLSFWPLLVICLVKGALTGIFGKVTNVILPTIVPKKLLGSATAANQTRDAAINLGSGPIGGFLFGLAPMLPFALSICSFFAELWSARHIQADLRPAGADPSEPVLRKLRCGVAWVFRHTLPRANFFIFLAFNISWTGIVTAVTLHLLATGTTSAAVGTMSAMLGGGVLLGGFISGWLVARLRGGFLLQLTYAWTLLVAVLCVFSATWWGTGLIFGAAAIGIVPMNSTLQAYMAMKTPDNLLGRMISVMVLSSMAAVGLSSAIAGALLDGLGYRGAILALTCVGIVGIVLCIGTREIREIPARSELATVEKIPG
ncbi:Predicted arabinose efflux permease, MFS family [Propionibacterium cyclohexanicum]|uniref:Predicted arabinose efflux permease, MFS family n=2 Tax=Propionibacterium cyclohexanicum TaxID=64702 RepID=A0A1H9U5I9_9ACTN|nr:Predicted arabinose efflux permease, MFS family [Propionibacterium cyclohexanicum]